MAPLTHALAQQAELRGGLSDTQVNRQLFSNASDAGIPSSDYEPFTQSPSSSEPAYAIDQGPFSDISVPERPEPRGRNIEEENIGEAGIDELATGTTPARTDERRADQSRASAAQAAVPAQVPVRRNDPNPYAPIGLRLGTFNAIPTLEQGLTYTTNADNAADAEEALLSETTLRLDATQPGWSATHNGFALILLVNLLHLISTEAARTLIAEAARALAPEGRFIVYGPFLRDGRATSDGDARFDAAIRADHPDAGYKNDADMLRWTGESGLDLIARTEMPANNLALVLVRSKDCS